MVLFKMSQKSAPDFFKLPNYLVMFVIFFGMILTGMCVYCPYYIPVHYLSIFGDMARYMSYHRPTCTAIIWYAAVTSNVFGAVYAYQLSGRKNIRTRARIKWAISTLCFGFGSLAILLKYNPVSLSLVDDLLGEMDKDQGFVNAGAENSTDTENFTDTEKSADAEQSQEFVEKPDDFMSNA